MGTNVENGVLVSGVCMGAEYLDSLEESQFALVLRTSFFCVVSPFMGPHLLRSLKQVLRVGVHFLCFNPNSPKKFVQKRLRMFRKTM